MSITWNLDTEVRWKQSVLREAENKNGRYPWNIFQTEKTEADLDDFTNSRLSNRYLRNISTNIIKERYIEKINKLS